MTNYTTHIVTELNEEFIKSWNTLWEKSKSATIYNSYEWFQTFSQDKKYRIYGTYNGKKLVAVLALTEKEIFKVKSYVPLGYHEIGGTPVLLEKYDEKIIKALFKEVLINNICITNVDESLASALSAIYPKSLYSLISVNPYLDLSKDYKSLMSKSNLKEMKKTIKKHETDFSLQIFTRGTSLENCLKTMIAIERKSSKKLKQMDILSKTETQDSFARMFTGCKKYIYVAFLHYKNKPIAYQFGFLFKDVFVAAQTAFVNKFKDLNPGRIMLYLLFEKLEKKKVRHFDLGGGISSYKQSFTPNYFYLYDLYSSKNQLIMFWWKGINRARRLKQNFFPKKFTRDHEFLFKTL